MGSTHTEARYVLPKVIERFHALFPGVRQSLHQGTPEQVVEMARHDRVDLAIASGPRELFAELILLPCYHGSRLVIVPRAHPLARSSNPRLENLCAYSLASSKPATR